MNRAVGSRTVRADAVAKVTGAAQFVDDLGFPGMLHAAVVRSPHPYARLRAIHPHAALALDGVVAVAAADDIPGPNVVHIVLDDQPLLAEEFVRYAGEPVALVAATSRDVARAAAAAVTVDYEPLAPLLDARESAGNAVRIFAQDNVFAHHRIRRGDLEAGFAAAAVVVEQEYRTGYQEHAYLEPQGMIAVPEPDGAMTVYGSMQCPFYVQLALCDTLGLPKSKVRVVQTVTGGGFGGKEDVPSLVAGQAALLARVTGRPVKLIYSREEDIAVTSKRHPARIRCRTGAAKDGSLVAAEVDMLYDGGAYATLSPVVLWRGTVHAVGAYRCPNVRVDARAVATNRVPCGAFRGFGSPQVLFAAESQMDRLAEALGLDPAEIRRRNLLRPGDQTITGQVLQDSVGAAAVLERALRHAEWEERKPPVDGEVRTYSLGPPILDDRRRRGRGLALVHYGSGLGAGGSRLDRSGAFVQLHEDASVTAAVGTTEMGQGMETVLGQLVAEELGVLPSDVRLLPADTSRVPDSGPTVASRSTTCSGNALRDACAPLRRMLLDVASEKLGVPTAAVDLLGGFARAGEKRVTIGEVVAECAARRLPLAKMGHHVAPKNTWNAELGQGDAYEVYAWAAVVADVVVDSATGQVVVERIVAAHDVGKAVNPTGVEAQIEGGSVQGAGYAVCEELLAPRGIVLNPDFGTYVIPTAADAPRVEPLIVEEPYPRGPHGAKGFGEQPLMAVAPAVIAAIHDAVGVRLSEIPATPERLLAALQGVADAAERTEPGAGCSAPAAPSAALIPVRAPAGPSVVPVTLMVNGTEHQLRVGVGETLLHVLRERLRLTGTKKGCGKGECGACTVLLDGKPVNACLVLAADAQDAEVLTIEGLGANGLHPLQRAFVEHGAIQCGFCTPGLVLSAKALLDRDPDPDEAAIRRGIAGNLCRCTGYVKVVAAIRAAAAQGRR
ncbi:MAG: molybdopterin-dependent oxidoreductase [Deltaproteobacteria bacterium]|nr:molybdopterin-dependent oxidoreductase [Deltaproteobacteria bacterium]